MTSLIRKKRAGILASAAGLGAAVALLTGCSEPVATGSRTHRWRDEEVRAGRTITRIALAFATGQAVVLG